MVKKKGKQRILCLRLTQEDHNDLMAKVKMTNLSKSEFIRRKLFDGAGEIRPTKEYQMMQLMAIEMSKVGSNINQIARAVNSMQRSGDTRLGAQQQRYISELKEIFSAWDSFIGIMQEKL